MFTGDHRGSPYATTGSPFQPRVKGTLASSPPASPSRTG